MSSSIPRSAGIYCIRCIPTNKVYIGSAHSIADRWSHHRSLLTRGVHTNTYLQRAWNKHGASSFTLTVLELVSDTPRLVEREQYYITFYASTDRKKGFNLRGTAHMRPGKVIRQPRLFHQSMGLKTPYNSARAERIRKYWTGRKHRPESIEKMRESKRGRPEHPNAARAKVEATSKSYIVTDPEGNEYQIKNLSAFCREHGLKANCMSNVACGRTRAISHQGWKCRKI